MYFTWWRHNVQALYYQFLLSVCSHSSCLLLYILLLYMAIKIYTTRLQWEMFTPISFRFHIIPCHFCFTCIEDKSHTVHHKSHYLIDPHDHNLAPWLTIHHPSTLLLFATIASLWGVTWTWDRTWDRITLSHLAILSKLFNG